MGNVDLHMNDVVSLMIRWPRRSSVEHSKMEIGRLYDLTSVSF